MRRHVLLVVIAVLLPALAGCGGEADEGVATRPDDAAPRLDDSVDGATAYVRRCAGCHGAVGSAQFVESLPGIEVMGRDVIAAKIRSGGEQMPSFATTLDDDEIGRIIDHIVARS